MSALRVGAIGGAVAAAAFAVSFLRHGLLGDAAFLIAIFAVVVTLGLLASMGLESLVGLPRGRGRWWARWSKARVTSDAPQSPVCGTCRDQMTRVDAFWICTRCDRVEADI